MQEASTAYKLPVYVIAVKVFVGWGHVPTGAGTANSAQTSLPCHCEPGAHTGCGNLVQELPIAYHSVPHCQAAQKAQAQIVRNADFIKNLKIFVDNKNFFIFPC